MPKFFLVSSVNVSPIDAPAFFTLSRSLLIPETNPLTTSFPLIEDVSTARLNSVSSPVSALPTDISRWAGNPPRRVLFLLGCPVLTSVSIEDKCAR